MSERDNAVRTKKSNIQMLFGNSDAEDKEVGDLDGRNSRLCAEMNVGSEHLRRLTSSDFFLETKA
jgi:hypothetical protein